MEEEHFEFSDEMLRTLESRVVYAPDEPDGLSRSVSRGSYFRTWTMSLFITAMLDNDSRSGSDYESSRSARQSTIASDCSLAPCASFCDAEASDHLLQDAVQQALPDIDLRARPSESLSCISDIWQCPHKLCGVSLNLLNLNFEQRGLVRKFSGSGTAMLVKNADGLVCLRNADPWKYMRYVDAIAWDHLGWHLHRVHVKFWFPHPENSYRGSPGWWWDDALLRRDGNLEREVTKLEMEHQQSMRNWMIDKTLSAAARKIRRARARLTHWRHQALTARRDIAHRMFGDQRDVIDVGLALVTLIREQDEDPQPRCYAEEIAYYRAVEAEWEAQPYARLTMQWSMPARFSLCLSSEIGAALRGTCGSQATRRSRLALHRHGLAIRQRDASMDTNIDPYTGEVESDTSSVMDVDVQPIPELAPDCADTWTIIGFAAQAVDILGLLHFESSHLEDAGLRCLIRGQGPDGNISYMWEHSNAKKILREKSMQGILARQNEEASRQEAPFTTASRVSVIRELDPTSAAQLESDAVEVMTSVWNSRRRNERTYLENTRRLNLAERVIKHWEHGSGWKRTQERSISRHLNSPSA
ncbi:hypothetical protein PENSPDRAFT_670860 [Peniophora sp. CONT]|nr:hypothetical protein PENSPDRAFT_670860 [Peniophora sp. CONT]